MKVPGYKIRKTIGRGGMATVYQAVQESLSREIVLKAMTTAATGGSDFVERFMNEGRMIASLQHPNIITIYDIGNAGDRVWIAMEWVKGGDLKTRITKAVPPAETLDLVIKIGRALGFAHAHGIVHRDVKPANILFREDGTPLLSDFGIAKQVQSDNELTSTGTILGSPFYMSPEQAEGAHVDGRTDIYSLGVIFYEMLTGERPYQGDTAIKVIMQHIQSPLPQLPPDLGSYQPLLDRMMAKDCEDRFPDTDALVAEAEALQEALSRGEKTISVKAAKPAPEPPPRSKPDRAPSMFLPRAVMLTGGLLLAAAVPAAFYYRAQALSAPQVLRERPSREQAPVAPAATPSTAPVTPQVTSGVPAVKREEVIKAREWLAKNSLAEDRLTSPPADNAHYYYSRLLALDPNNVVARRGFSEVAERFVDLAEKEFSRRNYNKALAYVTLGLQVDPGNRALEDLQSFIEHREVSVFDSLLKFFQSDS